MGNPKPAINFVFQKFFIILSDVEKFAAFNCVIIFQIRAKMGEIPPQNWRTNGSLELTFVDNTAFYSCTFCCAAFSHVNSAVESLSEIVLTVQDSANAVNVNTFD